MTNCTLYLGLRGEAETPSHRILGDIGNEIDIILILSYFALMVFGNKGTDICIATAK